MKPIALVGMTRLGLVSTKTLRHFRATRTLSLEEAQSYVFEPERLQTRFKLFENFCLKSYIELAAAPHELHAFVATSSALPDPFRTRLHELAHHHQFLHIVEAPDDGDAETLLRKHIPDTVTSERIFVFRYDDDDALATDFGGAVTTHGQAADDGTVLSFSDGLSVARHSDDSFMIAPKHFHLNAYGLGVYSRRAQPILITELGNHTRIEERSMATVIHIRNEIKWLTTVHAGNDSDKGLSNKPLMSASDAADALGQNFPHITAECLMALPYQASR